MSIRHPTHNGAEKRDRGMQITGVLILFVLIAILFVLVVRSERETEATATRAHDLAEQVRQACEAGGDAAKELGAACKQARQIEATPTVGAQGELGSRGPMGPPPSAAQVEAAVTAYCATHTCGTRGATGPAPSPGDIAKAVASYCNARGQCRGDDGAKGDKGDPPSAEQVASAVESYCAANNDCRGPAGADGRDGTDGQDGQDGTNGRDGRGIRSVECLDDGTWRITYTDGTTQEADGPCRARPVASP